MRHLVRVTGFVMLCSVTAAAAAATGDVSRDAVKGLDEQVQEIKQDVLAISTELLQLEEKLIHPSATQVSLFLAMEPVKTFRLDAVEVRLDGKPAIHHIYTHKELEALRAGGVQRLYTGNVRTGEHTLDITLIGKTDGNDDYREAASWRFTKEEGPRLVEVKLAGPAAGDQSIRFQNW
ncbi:MAG: hypothetical protein V4729_08095 [Pseudomonadota bacterium]